MDYSKLELNKITKKKNGLLQGCVVLQFFCPDGQYSATAGLFYQTPEESVIHLFQDPEGSVLDLG